VLLDVLWGQTPVTGLQLCPSLQSQAEEQLRPNCKAEQLLLQLGGHKTKRHAMTSPQQQKYRSSILVDSENKPE